MSVLPHNVSVATCTLIVTLAIGLGALTVIAGFSVWIAAVVGGTAAAIGWWAAACESSTETNH